MAAREMFENYEIPRKFVLFLEFPETAVALVTEYFQKLNRNFSSSGIRH